MVTETTHHGFIEAVRLFMVLVAIMRTFVQATPAADDGEEPGEQLDRTSLPTPVFSVPAAKVFGQLRRFATEILLRERVPADHVGEDAQLVDRKSSGKLRPAPLQGGRNALGDITGIPKLDHGAGGLGRRASEPRDGSRHVEQVVLDHLQGELLGKAVLKLREAVAGEPREHRSANVRRAPEVR